MVPLADLETLVIGGLTYGALVSVLTQAIKSVLPDKTHKVLPFIVGLLLTIVTAGFSTGSILYGLFYGLMATGEYQYVRPPEK